MYSLGGIAAKLWSVGFSGGTAASAGAVVVTGTVAPSVGSAEASMVVVGASNLPHVARRDK